MSLQGLACLINICGMKESVKMLHVNVVSVQWMQWCVLEICLQDLVTLSSSLGVLAAGDSQLTLSSRIACCEIKQLPSRSYSVSKGSPWLGDISHKGLVPTFQNGTDRNGQLSFSLCPVLTPLSVDAGSVTQKTSCVWISVSVSVFRNLIDT